MGISLKDMDQVEAAKGGAMLPTGYHLVTIESADEGTSSGGHPMVEFEFAGPQGTIRDWLVFAPSKKPGEPSFAMKRAKSLLDATGIEAESGDSEFPTKQLEGKKLTIFVGEEADNRPEHAGEMRRRVQGYEPPREISGDLPVDTSDDNGDLPF